jgi:hypothetical protein
MGAMLAGWELIGFSEVVYIFYLHAAIEYRNIAIYVSSNVCGGLGGRIILRLFL